MSQVKIGILGLEEAKRLVHKAKESGLNLTLEYNDRSCQRGCAVTVELWTSEDDFHAISKMMNEDFKTHARGVVDWEQTQTVVDVTKSEATCPACGCKFNPQNLECPDCGLCF